PQALPAEIARREALKAELDAACARLEAERADYERRKTAHETDGRNGGGRPPSPPAETPRPQRPGHLTHPGSRPMRKNRRTPERQSYNAQAAVDADGSQLVLGARVSQCASDANELVATVDAIPAPLGAASCVLADTGFANGEEVARLQARDMEVLVATGASKRRPHDFRPAPAEEKPQVEPKAEWLKAMKAKL